MPRTPHLPQHSPSELLTYATTVLTFRARAPLPPNLLTPSTSPILLPQERYPPYTHHYSQIASLLHSAGVSHQELHTPTLTTLISHIAHSLPPQSHLFPRVRPYREPTTTPALHIHTPRP